jgi:hypothetical protein
MITKGHVVIALLAAAVVGGFTWVTSPLPFLLFIAGSVVVWVVMDGYIDDRDARLRRQAKRRHPSTRVARAAVRSSGRPVV